MDFYDSGTASEAEVFSLSVSVKGDLRFSTKEGVYVRLDFTDGDHLKADAMDYLPANTIFDIAMQQTTPILLMQLQVSEIFSECEIAWANFIWSLVGGFFLAIGLGPFLDTGVAKPGLYNLLKSNPVVWNALKKFENEILSFASQNIKETIAGGLAVITVLYKEGMLWTLFKWALNAGIWWTITKVIAKILEVIFLPEAEVVELLASFTKWAVQLVSKGLDVGRACN